MGQAGLKGHSCGVYIALGNIHLFTIYMYISYMCACTCTMHHKATFLCTNYLHVCGLCVSSAGCINLYCIIFYRAIYCNA